MALIAFILFVVYSSPVRPWTINGQGPSSVPSSSSISYPLVDSGFLFEVEIAYAHILRIPDETFTMHLLWHTLAINSCSAYVKSCSSSGICPIQRPFTSARVGNFPFSSV